MASLKNTLIANVKKMGTLIPFSFLQGITRQPLVLPFYHTISDTRLPHIEHLYPVKGSKQFIEDLDFLLKHYRAIDLDEFEDIVLGKKEASKPSFLLTFDDGLREFYDVIAPILVKKGVPAICFLNSGFIDNKALFYRYKASLLVEQKTKESTSYLLSINYQNKDILDKIAEKEEYDFDAFLQTEKPYLSSTQIRSLIDQGFHFGSHSIDHPEYRFIDLNEQIRQTQESTEVVCNMFDLDKRLFSFPFTDYGVSKAYFDRIREQGILDYSFGSAGQKKDHMPRHFQRIALELGNQHASQVLRGELLYYMLKFPFGKNTIQRT